MPQAQNIAQAQTRQLAGSAHPSPSRGRPGGGWWRLGGRLLTAVLLLSALPRYAHAQVEIGGNTTPLKYSVHTYKITMGNIANDTEWGIYERLYNTANGRDSIDQGLLFQYTEGTHYDVDPFRTGKAGTTDSITIDFNGTLVVGETYTLVYKETSSDECYDYVYLDFTLQEPIDVDLDPDDLISNYECPDSNLIYVECSVSPDIPETRTSVVYHVVITNPPGGTEPTDTVYFPEDPTTGQWSFRYDITVTGVGGASAIIDTISYTGFTVAPGVSAYGNIAYVENETSDFEITVEYIDVPGVQQKIDFELTLIEGSFEEDDIDVIIPRAGENEKTHYINSIPPTGCIYALD